MRRKLGKHTLLALLAGTGLMLGGCGTQQSALEEKGEEKSLKEHNVVLVGKLQAKVADGYLLLTSEGVFKIDSNKVKLEEWLDQQITVEGQYSGDILFVDEIR